MECLVEKKTETEEKSFNQNVLFSVKINLQHSKKNVSLSETKKEEKKYKLFLLFETEI